MPLDDPSSPSGGSERRCVRRLEESVVSIEAMASGVKEDCGREEEKDDLVLSEKCGEVVHVGRVKRLGGRILQVLADIRRQLLRIRKGESRYCFEGMAGDAIDKHCQRCLLVSSES